MLLALLACVVAGFLSFASPCVVPLVPGYLSFLAGLVGAQSPAVTVAESQAEAREGRRRVVLAAMLFVLGFTVVFVLAMATVFGITDRFHGTGGRPLQIVGGFVTILMGLVFIGLVPALQTTRRVSTERVTGRRLGVFAAPLLGAVFALGWTPCLGPTLVAITAMVTGTEGATATKGVSMMIAYCAGLGIPFVVLALSSTWAVRSWGWLRRHTRTIQIIGGIALIIVGFALLTGAWEHFVVWLQTRFAPDAGLLL
nr:cytochrome c biogenesis protein CcdA [Gordonia araii]